VTNQLESGRAEQVRYVELRPREEIVDADYVRAVCDQAIAQMAAQKSGPARHEDLIHQICTQDRLLT
jgi:hypothetical protein